MFLTLLFRSLSRGWKKKLLVVIASAFAAMVVSAMLNVSLDVGDKMNKELKRYGANLIITPKTQALPVELGGSTASSLVAGGLIDESSLSKIKMVFWRNNIVGFAPYLDAVARADDDEDISIVGTWFNKRLVIPTGETVQTGIRQIKQWWKIDGDWPDDKYNEILVGKTIADRLDLKPGSAISFSVGEKAYTGKVAGVFESGDKDDGKIYMPLNAVQNGLGLQNKVGKVEISALTTPDNELAKKADANLDSLSPKEFETWYCTAYVSAIAFQLEEVIPGVKAKPIRQVSESEGTILQKIQLLIWILTSAALISSALGISSLMSASVLERRAEIGLSKSIGANDSTIVSLFITEAAVLGLLGGLLGYGAGIYLAKMLGTITFGADISLNAFVLPLTAILSVSVVWVSSVSAISTIIKLSPKEVLHGR